MKNIIDMFLVVLCGTIILWPWMIGAVDLLGWFFVDHSVTGIIWSDSKIVFSLLYPWIVGCVLLGLY